MIQPAINIISIVLALIGLNLLLVFFIKSYKRFFSGQLILFILFFISGGVLRLYIIPHTLHSLEKQNLEDKNKNGGTVSYDTWKSSREKRNLVLSYNPVTMNLLRVQASLCFVFSLIGYFITTEKRLFKRSALFYGIICASFIGLEYYLSTLPFEVNL